MSNGPDRRARRKALTRQRIVACAAELFAANGYDATTVEAVADCADVARATVFNHFDRKEDLVLAWFDRRREDLAERLAEGAEGGEVGDDAGGTAATRLRGRLCGIARFLTDDADTGRVMVRVWLQAGGPMRGATSASTHIFTQTLQAGRGRGEFDADADVDRAGAVLFHAYLGVLHAWANGADDDVALEDHLLDVLDVVVADLGGHLPD